MKWIELAIFFFDKMYRYYSEVKLVANLMQFKLFQ